MDPLARQLPLETQRLVLRDFRAQDFDALHAYASDREVVRFMPWGPNSVPETREFLARKNIGIRRSPRADWDLALELKTEARVIGSCGLQIENTQHRRGVLGYVLHRAYWGRGFAPEAARRLVDFGFEVLELHRIFATVDPDNRGSIRVLEKLGMRYEGRLREDEWLRTTWRDNLVYAVLQSEWTSSGAARDTKA